MKIPSVVALKSYSRLHGDVRQIMACISETNHMLLYGASVCHPLPVHFRFHVPQKKESQMGLKQQEGVNDDWMFI